MSKNKITCWYLGVSSVSSPRVCKNYRFIDQQPKTGLDMFFFSRTLPLFGGFGSFQDPTHPAAPGVQGHGQGDLRHLLRGGVHRGRPEAGCLAAGGLTWKDGIWCDMFWGGCLSIVYDCLWLFIHCSSLLIIVFDCSSFFIIVYPVWYYSNYWVCVYPFS